MITMRVTSRELQGEILEALKYIKWWIRSWVRGGGPFVQCLCLNTYFFSKGYVGTESSCLNWRHEEAFLLNLFQESKSLLWGLFAWFWCHQCLSDVSHFSCCNCCWKSFPVFLSTLDLVCGRTGPSQECKAWVTGSTHSSEMKILRSR